MNPSEPDMRAVLRTHLTRAIKHRDALAAGALRSTLGAIDDAEALSAAERRVLSPQDVVALVEAEIAQRRAASEEIEEAGRPDRAADLRREADVIEAALRFP